MATTKKLDKCIQSFKKHKIIILEMKKKREQIIIKKTELLTQINQLENQFDDIMDDIEIEQGKIRGITNEANKDFEREKMLIEDICQNIEFFNHFDKGRELLEEVMISKVGTGTYFIDERFFDNYKTMFLENLPHGFLNTVDDDNDREKNYGLFIVFNIEDIGEDYIVETGTIFLYSPNDKTIYRTYKGSRNSKYGLDIEIA